MIGTITEFLLCGLAILIAGTVLTRCADKIAEVSGLGRVFVGGVFLAAATSLPELTVDLALPGAFFGAVKPVHALTAFAVIAATTLAVMGQVLKPRERRWYLEPSPELIALLIAGLLWLLYRSRDGIGAADSA